jgi:hypothetical protein
MRLRVLIVLLLCVVLYPSAAFAADEFDVLGIAHTSIGTPKVHTTNVKDTKDVWHIGQAGLGFSGGMSSPANQYWLLGGQWTPIDDTGRIASTDMMVSRDNYLLVRNGVEYKMMSVDIGGKTHNFIMPIWKEHAGPDMPGMIGNLNVMAYAMGTQSLTSAWDYRVTPATAAFNVESSMTVAYDTTDTLNVRTWHLPSALWSTFQYQRTDNWGTSIPGSMVLLGSYLRESYDNGWLGTPWLDLGFGEHPTAQHSSGEPSYPVVMNQAPGGSLYAHTKQDNVQLSAVVGGSPADWTMPNNAPYSGGSTGQRVDSATFQATPSWVDTATVGDDSHAVKWDVKYTALYSEAVGGTDSHTAQWSISWTGVPLPYVTEIWNIADAGNTMVDSVSCFWRGGSDPTYPPDWSNPAIAQTEVTPTVDVQVVNTFFTGDDALVLNGVDPASISSRDASSGIGVETSASAEPTGSTVPTMPGSGSILPSDTPTSSLVGTLAVSPGDPLPSWLIPPNIWAMMWGYVQTNIVDKAQAPLLHVRDLFGFVGSVADTSGVSP